MKRIIFTLLAIFICLYALAYDAKIGDLYYNLNLSSRTAEVTYYSFFSSSNENYVSGAITIPAVVNCNSVEYPVTSIGERAFYNCSGLTNVEIPNSITSIGNYAFNSCSGLTSIEIPNSVTSIGGSAFSGCSSLTNVEIPNSITSIGDFAFNGCSGLTSIEIPNSVTSIGDDAFNSCSGLTSIEIPNSVTSIGDRAFYGCSNLTSIEIPNSVKSIGNDAFDGCTSIKEVTIKDGETTLRLWYNSSSSGQFGSCPLEKVNIGRNLSYNSGSSYGYSPFANQTKLTEVTIGEKVTTLPNYLLYHCTSLTSVEIPNSVTSIGGSAFSGCSSLTSVEIPNSVTSIGDDAFNSCSGLTSIEIPNSVTSIGYMAFCGCSRLTSVTIGHSVTSIGNCAFEDCSGLTSVTFPNSVTSIGDFAFEGCTSIKEVIIEDGDTTLELGYNSSSSGQFGSCPLEKVYIGRNLSYNTGFSYGYSPFANKTKLTEVTIGKKVTSLPEYVLYRCRGLTSVEIPNSVTSIGNEAFTGCTSIKKVIIEDGDTTLELGYNSSSSGQFGSCPLEKVYIGRNLSYNSGSSYGYSPFANQTKLTEVTIGEKVTTLPNYLLYHCTSLTSVRIGNSVRTIGISAFSGCSSLTSVEIGNSVTSIGENAFYSCKALTSVEIGNSVTTIGKYAFYNCSSLTSVTIGNSVTSIGEYTFYGCKALTNVAIGNSVTSIGGLAFYGCSCLTSVEIPNSVTSIGNCAFEDCSRLTSVTIGNSVTSIGDMAFYGCNALTSVEIPNSVTSIGGSAFSGCSSLTSVTIGNSVNSIGSGAFYECSRLSSVTIGHSVTSIGTHAFVGCPITTLKLECSIINTGWFRDTTTLKTLIIGNSVTEVANSAFSGCNSLKDVIIQDGETTLKLGYSAGSNSLFTYRTIEKIYIGRNLSYNSGYDYGYSPFAKQPNLASVTIGDKVTTLPNYLLYFCTGLTSVEIGNSVTSIGGSAFSGCSSLTSVEIPNSVTSIGEYAFNGCSALTSVEIPNSITSIGNYAFYGCTSLKDVIIEDGETTLILGYNSSSSGQFGSCSLETLHIGRKLSYSSGSSYGYSPFANQTKLTEVTIGEKVTSLSDFLLFGCSSLSKLIYSPGLQIASIGSSAFDDECYGSSIIYVTDLEKTIEILTDPEWNKFSKILYLLEDEEYVPITWDISVDIYGSGIIYNDEKRVLSRTRDDVNLKCSKAFKAFLNGQDITAAINSTEGYTYTPKISWKLNHITGAIEGGNLTRVVTLAASGELFNQIGVQDIQKIETLKVIGDINGTDVMTINRMTNLKNLDLSEANIVEGGQTYRDNLKTSTNIVGSYFFYDCNNLQNLILPSSATSIETNAFNGRSNLINVIIGDKVETIGESAFENCTNLLSIEIPNSVNSIGFYAFTGCSSLRNVNFVDGENSISLGYNTYSSSGTGKGLFVDCPLVTLHIGRNLFYSSGSSYGFSPFAKLKALTTVTIGEKVTSLSNYLLYNCNALTSIEIPNSVTSIGNYAFYGCTSLKDVIIEDGETTLILGYNSSSSGQFGSCSLETLHIGRKLSYSSGSSYGYSPFANKTKLKEVTISDKVTSLPAFLLYHCSSLTSVEIPNSVTSIGEYAFNGCSALTSVEIPNSITSIGEYAFNGCSSLRNVNFVDGENSISLGYNTYSSSGNGKGLFADCPLETLHIGRNHKVKDYDSRNSSSSYPSRYGYSPFANQTKLTEVTIGDKVTSLPNYLLYNCSGLTSVKIGNSVRTIGNSAFSGCSNMTSVTIPNSVTSIGNSGFYGCTDLTSVTIGNSVTSIGEYAFYDCTNLNRVDIFDLKQWCNITFEILSANPLYYAHHLYFNGDLLTLIEIPEGINKIKDYVFAGGSDFTLVTIPNSVTSIGNYAFAGCSGLTSVTIPNSVTSIGNSGFYGCTDLTSVTIGNSVTSIGEYAFYDCTNLNRVDIFDLKQWCNIDFGDLTANPLYYAHHQYINDDQLTFLEIPEGINKIKDFVFAGGSDFYSVTIPNSVTEIGESAFSNCSSITSFDIPNSVTSIESYVFNGCTSLSNVNLADGENPISLGYNTYSSSSGKGLFADCPLETLHIGRSYTVKNYNSSYPSASYPSRYGYSPFANQTKLKTVTIGDKITSLPHYLLYNCSGLTSVTIPNSVTSIGTSAFYGCSGLESVVLGDKLPAIGDNAFKGCSSLAKLYSLNPTPPKISASVFDGVDKEACLLMVTKGNLVYYWLDPVWKEFLNMSDDLIYLNPLPSAKYGDAPIDLAEYAPAGVTLSYETSNDDVARLEGTVLTIVGAGEATIGASYQNTGTPMELLGQMRQFIVDKADLTVSVNDVEVFVGQPVPALTLRVSGLCYDDTVDDIQELPTATCNVTPESAPGEYPVVLSGGKDNNYNFIFADSKVIVKARRTITIPKPGNVTYGDEPIDLSQYTPEGENIIYSLSDSELAEIKDNILTIKGAGTVTILASLPVDTSDAMLVTPELTLTIDKADLRIKVQDVTVVVGEDIPEFTLTAEGLCYDDTLEDVGELPVITCDAIKGSSPGYYHIFLEGGESENYNLILENGILTILDADTTTIPGFDENIDDHIIVVNYNGVVLYEGPEANMSTLEPGMYVIVKGKETKKLIVK